MFLIFLLFYYNHVITRIASLIIINVRNGLGQVMKFHLDNFTHWCSEAFQTEKIKRKVFADCFIYLVADCPRVFNTSQQSIKVYSKLRDFKSNGTFSCNVGEELFYKNGSVRLSKSTSCTAYATWNDQNNIKCGKGLYEKQNLLENQVQCLLCDCQLCFQNLKRHMQSSNIFTIINI